MTVFAIPRVLTWPPRRGPARLGWRSAEGGRGGPMSLFDLTGKVAIVTGSSRGIGRAIAERLAEHGAKVVISSRKQDACDEVASALNTRYGAGTAIAVAAGISSKDALEALVLRTNQSYGRIDVVV